MPGHPAIKTILNCTFCSLDKMSSFLFETYLRVLRHEVKSDFKPLQQLAHYVFYEHNNIVMSSKAAK